VSAWHTLVICGPEGEIRPRVEALGVKHPPGDHYGINQFVVWDGPSNRKDIVRIYEMLRAYSRGIVLFSGKGKSRLILQDGKIE
jgi:hypothetical protein